MKGLPVSTRSVPPPPVFGEPMPLGAVTPEVLAFLARRRSASAMTLRAPAPNAAELADLIRLAARVPDHGKLFPWRFVVIEGAAKDALVARLTQQAQALPNAAKALAALGKLSIPPMSVAVISRVAPDAAIPVWEQQLSVGAVCQTFLIAAEAMGFGANWITDWYAYEPEAVALLNLAPHERVAGFIHIGTPGEAPAERVRPDLDKIVSRL